MGRCVESAAEIMADTTDIEALKASIKEAERDVDLAERQVKNKKLLLNSLKKQLQDAIIGGVSGLKIRQEEEIVKKPAPPKDEATREVYEEEDGQKALQKGRSDDWQYTRQGCLLRIRYIFYLTVSTDLYNTPYCKGGSLYRCIALILLLLN